MSVPLFIGNHLIKLGETSSTNSYAMNLLRTGKVAEGTLVWAQNQTAGRGQPGTVWHSEAGSNLTFSLILHPGFLAAEKQFYLSKIAAISVLGCLTECLASSQNDILIKWPNDILVNEKKIAGILTESLLRGSSLQNTVIGLGLNVNQKKFCLRGTQSREPTSLSLLSGRTFLTEDILKSFCRHFEANYLNLKGGRYELINRLYLKNLFGLQSKRQFTGKDGRFSGEIIGIEEDGRLRIQSETGNILQFAFKEIIQH